MVGSADLGLARLRLRAAHRRNLISLQDSLREKDMHVLQIPSTFVIAELKNQGSSDARLDLDLDGGERSLKSTPVGLFTAAIGLRFGPCCYLTGYTIGRL